MSSSIRLLLQSFALIFSAMCILAGENAQASVVFVDRTSTNSINVCTSFSDSSCSQQQQGVTDFSAFSSTISATASGLVSSSQTSSIVGNVVSVQMNAATPGVSASSARSTFLLDFVLDAPTQFSITGRTYSYRFGAADAQLTLTGPTSFGVADVQCGTANGSGNQCSYNNTIGYPSPYSVTTLSAGSYSLAVNVLTNGSSPSGAIAQANLNLTFATPTPLPAAVWFLISGMGFLATALTRRKI